MKIHEPRGREKKLIEKTGKWSKRLHSFCPLERSDTARSGEKRTRKLRGPRAKVSDKKAPPE